MQMEDENPSKVRGNDKILLITSPLNLLENITFGDDELQSQPSGTSTVKRKRAEASDHLVVQDVGVVVSGGEQRYSTRGPTPSPNPFNKGVGGKLWDETFGRNTGTTQSSPWSSRMESNLSMEEASFNLFTQSFDTLSDTGEYRHREGSTLLHETTTNATTKRPSKVDRSAFRLDLPTLMPAETEVATGNISPIKVHMDREAVIATGFAQQGALRLSHSDGKDRSQPQHPNASPVWHDISQSDRGDHYVDERNIAVTTLTHNQRQTLLSNPFYVLRMSRVAFSGCSYLLDCLRDADLCAVNINVHGSFHLYRNSKEPMRRDDRVIAARRVEAAICAFGGCLKPKDSERGPQAIFRPKIDIPNSAPVNENAKNTSYEQAFHKRYVVTASKISWEVEEEPPVRPCETSSGTNLNRKRAAKEMNDRNMDGGMISPCAGRQFRDDETYGGSTPSPSASVAGLDVPKMKYRCKLCGKPKQNHDCPNLQSLQRSIGVMVYSAVNAFTAHEPGVLTPALSQMNNFVFYDSDHSPEPSYEQPAHSSAPRKPTVRHPSSVTPETPRTGVVIQSPQSSFSTPSHGHSPTFTLGARRQHAKHGAFPRKAKSQSTLSVNSGSVSESLFVQAVTLRPEHYRAVTPPKPTTTDSTTDYSYPAVPLTYVERKRLSDTLFCLSREIPSVSENCAAILRIAREKNEWDTAVAELLTQIVVGLYCGEGDVRLEGLHQYLLKLGVAC